MVCVMYICYVCFLSLSLSLELYIYVRIWACKCLDARLDPDIRFSDIMHGSQYVCYKPKLLIDYIFNYCTMVHNIHNHFIEATIIYYDYGQVCMHAGQ